jgi:DNA-binding IclR family transcriptional regulator
MIAADRQQAWVLHRSDYSTSVATGIRDHSGQIIAAINLSGPDAVMDSPGTQQLMIAEVLASGAAISRELGFSKII